MQNFTRKVILDFERGSFRIKTLENIHEVKKTLQLRHKVFFEELLHKSLKNGLDEDQFDDICDHLAVINKETNEIVGTYRLISSNFSNKFYSENEFDLTELKNQESINQTEKLMQSTILNIKSIEKVREDLKLPSWK